MLNRMRQSAGSWLIKGLLVLLVASFAVWGVEDMFRVNLDELVVAEVGDTDVPAYEVENALRDEVARFRQMSGGQIDLPPAMVGAIAEGVVGRLVTQALYVGEARELGIDASDEIIARQIRNDPAFQSSGGFDRFRFEQLLRNQGLSEAGFIQLMRRDLMRQQLADAVIAGASLPGPLAETLARYRGETRSVSMVMIDADSVAAPAEPDREALAAFHQENASQFTDPERRDVSLVALTPEALASEMLVPDEEIAAAYQAQAHRFMTPAKRNLRQMLLPDKDTADRAKAALDAGGDFAEVAQEIGSISPDALGLGEMTRSDLPDAALADAAFSAEEGTATDPVETPLGWHILMVDAATPEVVLPLEIARDPLRQELALEKAYEGLFGLADRLADELAAGSTLEEAAAAVDLGLHTVKGLARDGDLASADSIDRVARSVLEVEAVLNQAFALPEGQASDLIETPEGGIVVLRVDSVTEPKLKPLDDVIEAVRLAWIEEARSTAAKAEADALAEAARQGDGLSETAAAEGHSLSLAGPITRDAPGVVGGLSTAARDTAFELDEGEIAVAEGDGGWIVLQLDKVTEAPAPEEAATEIAQRLQQSVTIDVLDGFTEALREARGVTIDRAALQQLISAYGG